MTLEMTLSKVEMPEDIYEEDTGRPGICYMDYTYKTVFGGHHDVVHGFYEISGEVFLLADDFHFGRNAIVASSYRIYSRDGKTHFGGMLDTVEGIIESALIADTPSYEASLIIATIEDDGMFHVLDKGGKEGKEDHNNYFGGPFRNIKEIKSIGNTTYMIARKDFPGIEKTWSEGHKSEAGMVLYDINGTSYAFGGHHEHIIGFKDVDDTSYLLAQRRIPKTGHDDSADISFYSLEGLEFLGIGDIKLTKNIINLTQPIDMSQRYMKTFYTLKDGMENMKGKRSTNGQRKRKKALVALSDSAEKIMLRHMTDSDMQKEKLVAMLDKLDEMVINRHDYLWENILRWAS